MPRTGEEYLAALFFPIALLLLLNVAAALFVLFYEWFDTP